MSSVAGQSFEFDGYYLRVWPNQDVLIGDRTELLRNRCIAIAEQIKRHVDGVCEIETMFSLEEGDAVTALLLKALTGYREECPCVSGSINRQPCDFCEAADKAIAMAKHRRA